MLYVQLLVFFFFALLLYIFTDRISVVKVLDGAVPVFLDGGIIRGSDVFKALALGARGVLVGRTVMAGLAVNQSQGVYEIISGLTEELKRIMNLTGSPDINSIDPNVIWRM